MEQYLFFSLYFVQLRIAEPPLGPPKGATKDRATRLPDDWAPSLEDRAYANAKGLRQIDAVAEKFANYWHAKAGSGATKLDWPATWRNWVLTEVSRQPALSEMTAEERYIRSTIQ